MNEIQVILDQFQLFVQQHVPARLLTHAALVSFGVLIAGVLVSVFGAKLARVGIAGVFVILGGLLGMQIANYASLPAAPCIVVAAAMVGAIGAMTHKLWVGMLAAGVVAAVVLGVFSYQKVIPHVSSYQPMVTLAAADDSVEFVVPSPLQQQDYVERSASQWFSGLWAHIGMIDACVAPYTKALALAAATVGLFIGVLLPRFTLIVSTSLIGTILVTAGLLAVLTKFSPAFYQTGLNHPVACGLIMGGLMGTSLFLQAILTRSKDTGGAEPADAA